jgi:peptidoglycan/xylan/chitin deacetylase (PgdA/CDA1 family)
MPSAEADRGVFTLSLDFELLWGAVDLFGPEKFRRACEIEREHVVGRLLDLLEAHDVSATWCVLGHLLLERCSAVGGRPHPDMVRPRHAWVRGDWYRYDPCSTESEAPLFYGRRLVEKIRACRVPQEIGCHSFSHAIFSDPGCSREAAASELGACVKAAGELGLELRSFAFPRNGVGHLDLLPDFGFTSYRGPAPRWYERQDPPSPSARLARLACVLSAATPPVVTVEPGPQGLWNVPASMMYFPNHGIRRTIPVKRRIRRALKGVEAAVQKRQIFHLWFHPTNLADDPDAMFAGLRAILERVVELRRTGRLTVAPMGALVPQGRSPGALRDPGIAPSRFSTVT